MLPPYWEGKGWKSTTWERGLTNKCSNESCFMHATDITRHAHNMQYKHYRWVSRYTSIWSTNGNHWALLRSRICALRTTRTNLAIIVFSAGQRALGKPVFRDNCSHESYELSSEILSNQLFSSSDVWPELRSTFIRRAMYKKLLNARTELSP